MVMMEPPTIDMRIANQYSFFSIVPDGVKKVEDILEKCSGGVVKYVINKNIRWELRDMLDQGNINERIVYPGLDGIASWLGRYYYVRELTKLEIKTMSLSDLSADVIVNPSNVSLKQYSGVNRAIFHKAGDAELASECEKVTSQANVGAVVATKAGKLSAKAIYHVVGKSWDISKKEESEKFLRNLYRKVLDRVKEEKFHSVGFPLLSAGANGCPVETAWRIAIEACLVFQQDNPGYQMTITICVIDAAVQKLGEAVRESIIGNTDVVDDESQYIGNGIRRHEFY